MIRRGMATAAVMLIAFSLFLTAAYWLRHERLIWDQVCWVQCP